MRQQQSYAAQNSLDREAAMERYKVDDVMGHERAKFTPTLVRCFVNGVRHEIARNSPHRAVIRR